MILAGTEISSYEEKLKLRKSQRKKNIPGKIKIV